MVLQACLRQVKRVLRNMSAGFDPASASRAAAAKQASQAKAQRGSAPTAARLLALAADEVLLGLLAAEDFAPPGSNEQAWLFARVTAELRAACRVLTNEGLPAMPPSGRVLQEHLRALRTKKGEAAFERDVDSVRESLHEAFTPAQDSSSEGAASSSSSAGAAAAPSEASLPFKASALALLPLNAVLRAELCIKQRTRRQGQTGDANAHSPNTDSNSVCTESFVPPRLLPLATHSSTQAT